MKHGFLRHPIRGRVTAALILISIGLGSAAATAQTDAERHVVQEVLKDPINETLSPNESPILDGPSVLPPIPTEPANRAPDGPNGGDTTLVLRKIIFEGNTTIDDATLREVAVPWLGRPISATDLEGLRDALTAVFVREGYLTSGAVFPVQALSEEGRLVVQIVEGRLESVQVKGAELVVPAYYEKRILLGLSDPLHVPTLEARLRQLQRNPFLSAIHATIRPGEKVGEAILDVEVEERSSISVAAYAHNQLSPSLGEVRLGAAILHRSVSGFGDNLIVGGDYSEAGGGIEAIYQAPLNAGDLRAQIMGRYRSFDVSDGLGRALDIESEYWSVEAGLYQPFRPQGQLSNWEFGLGFIGELSQSKITFLESDRPFPLLGSPNGKSRLAVLRLVGDAVHRRPRQVVAFRTIATLGIDAFGATRTEGSLPDGRFWSWITQLQAVRQVTPWNIELIGRAAAQLTNQRVFGLAQFSLGGPPSVRGYRQNRIVRDEGITGGVEVRVPIWREAITRKPILQLASFVDAGRAWSRHERTDSEREETLASVGLGMRAQVSRYATGELYWARPLRDTDHEAERSALQDSGIHFRVTATWP